LFFVFLIIFFAHRDPTRFGLVLSFLRDQSFQIKPPSQPKRLGRPATEPEKEALDSTEPGEALSESIALVRELSYYGLLNYVLPRQVEAELTQWCTDFAEVFSIERYHQKVAQLWVDHLAKEADVAGDPLLSPTSLNAC
jgi:hypothetical protein